MLVRALSGPRNRKPPQPAAPLALEITDFASLPITGLPDGTGNNAGSLARVNVMRQEPGPAGRFFVNDLTGPLYILDRTKSADDLPGFQRPRVSHGPVRQADDGRRPGERLHQLRVRSRLRAQRPLLHHPSRGDGAARVARAGQPERSRPGCRRLHGHRADPDARVGRPRRRADRMDRLEHRKHDVRGPRPRTAAHSAQQPDPSARRLSFNPAARPGDADWRVLYVACGDGGSGDSRGSIRLNPQRLDTLVGKILRIVPDLAEHANDSTVSDNGRYRVPRDNPFVAVAGAPPGDLGLRRPQPASSRLARRRRNGTPHRLDDRLANVGDRAAGAQRRELRLSAARRRGSRRRGPNHQPRCRSRTSCRCR